MEEQKLTALKLGVRIVTQVSVMVLRTARPLLTELQSLAELPQTLKITAGGGTGIVSLSRRLS